MREDFNALQEYFSFAVTSIRLSFIEQHFSNFLLFYLIFIFIDISVKEYTITLYDLRILLRLWNNDYTCRDPYVLFFRHIVCVTGNLCHVGCYPTSYPE